MTADAEIEDALYRPDGILAGLEKGGVILEMSTATPGVVQRASEAAAERGVETKLSYTTGPAARTYELYYGSAAMGKNQTWTKLGASGQYLKTLDSVINFPADSTGTPQTFNDIDGDGKLDVIFLPNGSCSMPTDRW